MAQQLRSEGCGDLVRGFRLAGGLTQEELAERADLSVRAIRDVESGKAVPRRGTTGRLALALGLQGASLERFNAAARDARAQRRPQRHAMATPSSSIPIVQMPHTPANFCGRETELAMLTKLAECSSPRICLIDGSAGIGKTALATRFAHDVADLFADGVLFVDLQGFDSSRPPLSSAAVLGRFLRALGVDSGVIADTNELAAVFRSVLADRQVLLVLDNAAAASQVRPLLPGMPGCFVVVTSRRRLPSLVACDGAHRITLDALDEHTAVDLLARASGRDPGVDAEDLKKVVRLCGRLPLALCIAAERIGDRTALTDLIKRLDDDRGILDLLTTGENDTGVRDVFALTYQALDAETARLFRMLSTDPRPNFSLSAACAVAQLPLDQTRRLVDRLLDCHMIERAGTDSYRLHVLLRAYAMELSVFRGDVRPQYTPGAGDSVSFS